MATNFPGSQDSFTNPNPSSSLNFPSHSAQHANVNDAVEAIEVALLDGAPVHIDDANERLGVGTTSPAHPLDVTGTGRFTSTLTIGEFTFPATDGSANQVLVTNGSGTVTWQNQSGGGGSPGGSDGQVQYNNGGSFGGASGLHYDDGNARVGIGTTSPARLLHIYEGASGVTSQNGAADLIIESNDQAGIALNTPNTGVGYLRFVDPDDSAQGGLSYAHSTDKLSLRTSGSDKVVIDSAGALQIQNGSASAPSFGFVSDTNTGIYRQAENEIGFATGGAERFRMGSFGLRGDDSGNVYNVNLFRGNNGSSSAPTFSFDSDSDTGVYLRSTGQLAFSNAGTESFMTTAGFYLASGDWFRAQGSGGFYFQTYGGGWQMTDSTYVRIYNTKSLYLSNEIFVPNMDGTSSNNTVRFVASTGQLKRFTSISEVKEDITSIKPMMEYLNERSYLYDLRPVLFHEKDNADGTTHAENTFQVSLRRKSSMSPLNFPSTVLTANLRHTRKLHSSHTLSLSCNG